ncbi:Sodium channel type 11 subunit alpha [Gossypium arboreum]|uniref:Sodium channel type 11 subunit alpha n=1 Tax=Gossypium arboreum TaxID=29729 RepID=A0A0B0PNL3_GOSAR|nr:Sodium channel type 11 subunit alpha [Gossypium arboreum]
MTCIGNLVIWLSVIFISQMCWLMMVLSLFVYGHEGWPILINGL